MADRKITITMSLQDLVSGNLQKITTSTEAAMKGFDNLEQNTKKAASGMEQINKVMKAGLAIWGARAALGFVGDLNELGMAAKTAASTFEALQGSSSAASDTLALLRGVTMGVVDDITLMTSSNRLMQMGLATSTEDLARFTEMAVKLGRAMGQDASTALENFALMVSNKSYLRLDTYGLSAGAVRDRVAELKAETEGLSTEQAFLIATLEQGEIALDRIEGTIADTGTAAERLSIRLENVKTQLAGIVAGALEAGAQLGELFVMMVEHPGAGATQDLWNTVDMLSPYGDTVKAYREALVEAQQAIDDAAEKRASDSTLINAFSAAFDKIDSVGIGKGVAEKFWEGFVVTGFAQTADIGKVFEYVGMDMEGMSSEKIQKLSDMYSVLSYEIQSQLQMEKERAEALSAYNGFMQITEGLYGNVTGWLEKQSSHIGGIIEDTRAYAKEIKEFTSFESLFSQYGAEREGAFNFGGTDTQNAYLGLEWQREITKEAEKQFKAVEKLYDNQKITNEQYALAEAHMQSMRIHLEGVESSAGMWADDTRGKMNVILDQMNAIYQGDTVRDFGGVEIISDETAEHMDWYNEKAAELYNELERMHELDLITDEDLQGAESLFGTISDMSEKAWDAANAIEKMGLNELLGRQGGGVVGEIGDAVIAQMEEAGAGEEQIQAFRDAMELESGRETNFGQKFEDEIIPMFADLTGQVGAEESARLMTVAAEAIKAGRELGLSDAQLMAYIENATGYGFGGGGMEFSVEPGQGPEAVAQQYGMSVDDVMAIAGRQGSPYIYTGDYATGGGAHALTSTERGMNAGILAGEMPPAMGSSMFNLPMGEGEGMADFSTSMAGMEEVPFADMTSFLEALGSEGLGESTGVLAEKMGELSTGFQAWPQAVEDADLIGTEMQSWSTYAEKAEETMRKMITFITQSVSKPYTLHINVKAVGGGGLGAILNEAVKDNGGSVPGADARSSTGSAPF